MDHRQYWRTISSSGKAALTMHYLVDRISFLDYVSQLNFFE